MCVFLLGGENMNALAYSIKLESSFNNFCNENKFKADSFKIQPTEAIHDGLTWIMSKGIISKEDLSRMCNEFDFGTLSLTEIINDEYYPEKLDELLKQLEYLSKNERM